MATTNKKLKNREYCRKYRQKNLEELRKRDTERKIFFLSMLIIIYNDNNKRQRGVS